MIVNDSDKPSLDELTARLTSAWPIRSTDIAVATAGP